MVEDKGERLAKVETEVKNLKDNNTKEHKEIKSMIKSFIESADKRYAPRWLMTVLSWIAGIFAVIISVGAAKYFWGA